MAFHELKDMSVKDYTAQKIAESLGLPAGEVTQNFAEPPDSSLGDLSFKTFSLSKKTGRPPHILASDISRGLEDVEEFIVEPAGPYVNITFKAPFVCSHTVRRSLGAGSFWGESDKGRGKTIVIDYSSPNIAKPFGVGHLRSTVIGASICRILRFTGYDVVGINHLGDWGTQFGIILAGLEEEKIDLSSLGSGTLRKAYEIYVKYSAVSKENPAFMDKARSWFSRLEKNDTEALKFWETIRDSSLNEFKKTYSRLGIEFERYLGESFYFDKTSSVLNMFAEKNLSKKDMGATIVPLEEYGLPPVLLTKSDGSTLYSTREIASALYRLSEFKPFKLLYVVGTPQELHFKQLQAALEKAGIIEKEKIVHAGFGHIQGMSSRKGNLIFLEDFLEEASSRAKLKIEEGKHAQAEGTDLDELAFSIGAGAVIFNDLKNKRTRDVDFDWDRALSFEGETGPYLQYAHARICSILRKAGDFEEDPSLCLSLESHEEKKLALAVDSFPEHVLKASEEYEPSVVSRYLLDLAGDFSTFYHSHRVLSSDETIRHARLNLLKACKSTLSQGLSLLGIKPVEVM